MILKVFGHLTGKFYLMMDQEIQVYFMTNPDLLGNEQGLPYGTRSTFYFLFIFGFMCLKVTSTTKLFFAIK